ncbi:MAG: Cys-Gln thioester bond-forming surface protein [Bacilli bacterium]|nr:Cys-Gln thioester bond-forming surface protein [Bacilli bacterium]
MKKKKIIKLLAIAFASIISILGITKVNAQMYYETLVDTKQDGIYYTRRGGGKPYLSAQYSTYTMNGKVVYCIEPGVDITINDYTGADGFINSPYDDATNKKIELIGHYGYDYPGHQTLRYRMAAQSLIWETTGGQIIEFWTERYGNGDFINLNYERNEIMKLVNAHYNKPSFNGSSMEVVVGKEYKITDTNGLMNEYALYKAEGLDVRISGNDIYFTPKATGNLSLSVARKHYDNHTTIVFKGNDELSQKMGYFRFSDPVVATLNLNVIGGKIKITKVDSETNTTNPQGQATLVGAKYNVIDSSGKVVDTLTIGSDSTAITGHMPLGTYTIKEVSPSTGYYLNNTTYTATVNSSDTVNITVKEDVIKNYISILKQYDYVNGNTTFLNAEANITFEIFYPDGSKYGEIKTDKNGYATLNIPYGVWKFHQVNTTTGFEKIYDFYITVDENSEKEQYYNILNNKISAYVRVVKKDSETGKTIAIPNVKFKIQNTDTKQYVSQYVGGKVYDSFMTDENGVFTTYLPMEAGNYKLVEIESPKGYLLSKDGVEFTIGENTEYNYTTYGAIVVVEFDNTPIKGQVEIFKNGEKFVVEDGTFSYKDISLKGIKFNIYADEDIKSADGNYLYYNKGDLVQTIITDENGYAKSKSMPLGKFYLVEVETKDNYVLDTKEYHFELTQKDNKTAIVYNTYKAYNYLKKGTLEFTKNDFSTSDPIPNVEFEIYTDKDELIYSGKTDENGKIIIEEIAVGKFYIVEKNPAEGYVSNDEKVYFEIKEDGEIVKAEMTNKKITSTLKITKVDEEEKLLSGVKFGIYDLEDNLIEEVITNEEGLIEIELEYGKYYFKEISTLEQYVISDKKIYFEVKENGAIIEEKVVNEFVEGTLEFTKTDLITGDVIPNTLIEIYTEDDELIFSGKTDENGKIVVEELRYGKFYIIEKEAETGFVITDEKVYFEIKEDGEIVKAEMTNRPILGTLEFTKIDISTSEPLPNTLIEIYNENDELIFTGKTDENGMIIIEELRYGKFYIIEKEAPEGYILNEEKMFFEIKEDGEIVKATMVNEKVVIEVPNTGLNDYHIYEIISGVLVLSGLGVIIYAKKKRKKQ